MTDQKFRPNRLFSQPIFWYVRILSAFLDNAYRDYHSMR